MIQRRATNAFIKLYITIILNYIDEYKKIRGVTLLTLLFEVHDPHTPISIYIYIYIFAQGL